MPLEGHHTFVGFGLGAIQAGLFLYEAFHSGNFRRLVSAEIQTTLVEAIRKNAGRYAVNVAWPDRVESEEIGVVEVACPRVEQDRNFLIQAVAEAQEISTALPTVQQYISDEPGSVHRIIAAGLRRKAAIGGPRAVVYAAENHNQAAEILQQSVFEQIPAEERSTVGSNVQFLNTVIGKMSGVVADKDAIQARRLSTITPCTPQAFLVESFNRIFISAIALSSKSGQPFRRGITVFEEKADLLPFEESKLYGHNSTHALAAYIASLYGAKRIMDVRNAPGAFAFLQSAFIQESGEMLIRRHAGLDYLFTREGYTAYALDLLARIFNPRLGDTVERVGRDPARKLEWNDRLIGTLRIGLRHGVPTPRYAMGAAAALAQLDRSVLEQSAAVEELLDPIWSKACPEPTERQAVLQLVEKGRQRVCLWRARNFPDIENLIQASTYLDAT